MGLMAFGAAGLVLIAAAGALVLASLSAVDDAATGFEEQRREILAMLGPASAALEGRVQCRERRDQPCRDPRRGHPGRRAHDPSGVVVREPRFPRLVRRAGGAAVRRDLGPVRGGRIPVADLSTDLGDAAAAMEANITDSAAVAADLRVLAAQLEELEASLGGGREGETPEASAASLPVDAARFVLWACCCGWRFRRSPRSGLLALVPGRPGGLIRPHLVSPRLSRAHHAGIRLASPCNSCPTGFQSVAAALLGDPAEDGGLPGGWQSRRDHEPVVGIPRRRWRSR